MNSEKIKALIKNFNESDYFDNVDLHIHSNFSDGELSPSEIVERAKEKGLKYFAICDHNTLKAYTSTNIAKEESLITGVEFDCWYKGILIHILGYGIDYTNKELQSLCAKTKVGTSKDIVRLLCYRDPKKVIKAIKHAGGIAILAHPACYWAFSLEGLVKKFITFGLDGIEVYYPYKRHRKIIKFHTIAAVKRIAEKFEIIQTGGSDCHGKTL